MHGQHYAGERLRVEISYDNSRGRGRGRGGGRGAPPPRRGRDERGPPPRERSPPYERDSRGHRPPSYERERDHHRRDFSPRGPPGRGVRERSPYDRYESRAPAPPPPSYRDYRDRRESPPGRYRSRESPPRGPPRGGPRDYERERERERERAPPYVMAPERRRPDRYTSDRYRSRSPGPPPGPPPRDNYFRYCDSLRIFPPSLLYCHITEYLINILYFDRGLSVTFRQSPIFKFFVNPPFLFLRYSQCKEHSKLTDICSLLPIK